VTPEQRETLSVILSQPVKLDCSMKSYTSFSVGGVAEAVVKVVNITELQRLLCFLQEEKIAWRAVGRGTNLLVRDEGYSGVIVLLAGDFRIIGEKLSTTDESVVLTVGCGCGLGRLGQYCIEQGLSGLEFTSGIPGSVGGAVLMNAGAWGRELSSVIKSVTVLTCDAMTKLLKNELDFTYRCWPGFSRFYERAVIIEAELELSEGDEITIKEECRTLLKRRKKSQPVQYANAGSFFKNPPGESAGRLIEASGFKGMTVGGAMISEQHANFLVNRGGATASDIFSLMKIVQKKVIKESGVRLEPEIHFI